MTTLAREATALQDAETEYIDCLRRGRALAKLLTMMSDGTAQQLTIVKLLTCIGDAEARFLFEACHNVLVGSEAIALRDLRRFIKAAAAAYAADNKEAYL